MFRARSFEPITEQLASALATAREQVPLLTNDDLPFKYVMSVLACFGPRWNRAVDEEGIGRQLQSQDEVMLASIRGWQRRAWNALLGAEKLVPLWKPELIPVPAWRESGPRPLFADFDFQDVVEAAKPVVLSVFPHLYARALLEPMTDDVVFWAHSGEKRVDKDRSASAYRALQSALALVARDELHEFSLDIDYPLRWEIEGELEWEGILSVYHSSMAFSRTRDEDGSNTDENGRFRHDKDRLQEFWLWWLDEAVPASWFLRDL